MRAFHLLWVLPLLVACGPGARDTTDAGFADAANAHNATVSGVVWAPGNAPGLVPEGEEIPVSGAVVYLSSTPPEGIPAGAFCSQCVEPPAGAVVSSAKGAFTLSSPPGTYTLVIQKGLFRRERQVTLEPDQDLQLTAEESVLPSEHVPSQGKWLPHVAVATGRFDEVETIFGKMGIGMIDEFGVWVGSTALDNIDLYDNGGVAGGTLGTFDNLLRSLSTMMRYHIIVVPCANSNNGTSTAQPVDAIFSDPTVRQNIRDYVAAGGKMYVSDWSAEYSDIPYPQFITFTANADNGNPDCLGTACPEADVLPAYATLSAQAVDDDLRDWLDGQQGPDENGELSTYSAAAFRAVDNFVKINGLPTVALGEDDMGNPVSETAKVWVKGPWTDGEDPIHPYTVTFEPNGCGRVLYSTFHTAPYDHLGLVPQERVLVYLLLEVGVCKEGPIVD
jgi:hypothetical protein